MLFHLDRKGFLQLLFLLVETNTEIRKNLFFKKNCCYGKLNPAPGETHFPASRDHLFPTFFRDSCQFFPRLVWKYFSTKSFIPASGNRFSGRWKPFWFAQSFFLLVETITEISGSQFLKEYHIITNKNWFSGLWKPFSFLSFGTVVKCCQWKQFILQLILQFFMPANGN